MGLDSVELVMAFEEEFGISIPDSAAGKMMTPRHVIDFVQEARARVEKMDAHAHVVGVLAQMGYADLGAETRFNELFLQRGRIRQWREFCSKLAPFSAPSARSSGPGCSLFGAGVLGVIVGVICGQAAVISASVGLCVLGFGVSHFSEKIPEETDTLQKLIERLTRPVPREEVAALVKQIVLEQLGLPESTYGEDKRFIEDFGVD